MLLLIFLITIQTVFNRIIFQKINLEGRKEITILGNRIGSGPYEIINVPLGAYLIIKFRLFKDAEVILDDRDPNSFI